MKRISPLERELRERFREEVLAKRPVLGIKEQPHWIVDPHHVIKEQTLRTAHRFRLLTEEERLHLRFDPSNGIPVERPLHDLLTVAMRRLHVDQLRPENIAFAEQYGLEDLLAREVPSYAERAASTAQETHG